MIEQTTATESEWDNCYRERFFLGGKRLPPPPRYRLWITFLASIGAWLLEGGLKRLQPRFRDFAVKTSSGSFLFLASDLQFGCVEHNFCAALCGF